MKFDKVIELLQSKKNCCRLKWMGEDLAPSFITMQIPSTISHDIIPNMTSLNDDTKTTFASEGVELHYDNQVLGVNLSRGVAKATYYIPSWEDIFADDWVTYAVISKPVH